MAKTNTLRLAAMVAAAVVAAVLAMLVSVRAKADARLPAGKVEITKLDLKDPTWKNQKINGYNHLYAYSTDYHRYYDGYTRFYGDITIKGAPKDQLDTLKPEFVDQSSGIVAKGRLSDAARKKLLNQQFGSDGVVSFSSNVADPKPLFLLPAAQGNLLDLLPAAQGNLLDSDKYTFVKTEVAATTQRGLKDNSSCCEMPKLVRYTAGNRYGTGRDRWAGGDDWVLPTVRTFALGVRSVIAGTVYNDFSNMNGAHFPPHITHANGNQVDAKFPGYAARDATVANRIIEILKDPTYGTKVRTVYVTFNAPGGRLLSCEDPQQTRDTNHSAFYNAIQNKTVPAPGGGTRNVTDVIRIAPYHCGHFHLDFVNR
jgi:hypothetical protein